MEQNMSGKKLFVNFLNRRVRSSNIAGVVGILVLITVVMLIIRPDFVSLSNINLLLSTISITAVAALGQTVVISMGALNLALGSIGGLASICMGFTMANYGVPAYIAIPIAIIVGMVCGMLTGLVIVRLGFSGGNSFLATLAISGIFTGISVGSTKATPITALTPGFKAFGQMRFLGFNVSIFLMIAIAIIIALMYRFTGFGRQLLSVGSNKEAAALYGVSINKTVILAYMVSGLLAAIAGVLLSAWIGSVQVNYGASWLLLSFAGPIMGGVVMAGGRVHILGVVLGTLVLCMIDNCLIFLGITSYWTQLIQGFMILAAISIDRINYRRMTEGRKEFKYGE